MSVPQVKIPQVMGCAVRVALLDDDGTPTGGAFSSYTTDALAKLTVTPVYTDGQEIKETNACGVNYVDYLAPSTFDRADIEIDFLTPDPFLMGLLVGGSAAHTVSGAIGWSFPPIGVITGEVSIEVWAQRINGGVLDPTFPYAHWALPLVNNLRLGAKEFSNSAQHTIVTGQAYENANWFDGPANDWPSLQVPSTKVAQWIPTTTIPDGTTGTTVNVTAS